MPLRWLQAVLVRVRGLATRREAHFTLRSKTTREWMYAFKPEVGGIRVYLKVILRTDCVVISCHEERDQSHEDE
jgi:hypothetical protein